MRTIRTQHDWNLAQSELVDLARRAAALPLDEMIQMFERSHALAPIMDPTLYRQAAQKMDEFRQLARAAKHLHDAAKASPVLR